MTNKPGEANFFPDVPQFPSMGTFQPVYGKFDLTTYIQGASDYEIMAFLVGKYNACLEAYGNITKLSTETITACKQLQDWINSWFDNLDVQDELNKKIDSMVQDGSFGRLLHQTFDEQINQQTTSAVTKWLVANVTPAGSAVVVDKSLSIDGAAADAKATGENIYNNPFASTVTITNYYILKGSAKSESDNFNTHIISASFYNSVISDSMSGNRSIGCKMRTSIPYTITRLWLYLESSFTRKIRVNLSKNKEWGTAKKYCDLTVTAGTNYYALDFVADITPVPSFDYISFEDMPSTSDPITFNAFVFTSGEMLNTWNSILNRLNNYLPKTDYYTDKTLTRADIPADSKSTGKNIYNNPFADSVVFIGNHAIKGTARIDKDNINTHLLTSDAYNSGDAVEGRTERAIIGVLRTPIPNSTKSVWLYVDSDVSGPGIIHFQNKKEWGTEVKNVGINFPLDTYTQIDLPSDGTTLDFNYIGFSLPRDCGNTIKFNAYVFTSDEMYKTWKKLSNKVNIGRYSTDIIFWGDSLTAGYGGDGTNYPDVCAKTLGRSYMNMGVGGETAYTIASRQGGNNLVINKLTDIALNEMTALLGTSNPLRQGKSGVNPIDVAGQECQLTITQTDSIDPNAKYNISGFKGDILAETPVKFSGADIKGKVTVIFVGQNGPQEFKDLSAVIDSMIRQTNGKVVILGLSTGNSTNREALEKDMLSHYGNTYFNTRNMLSKYGMKILNLTPTSDDTAAINSGTVPPSLRHDSTHLNANGYTALGKLLADKIKSLGYLDMV